MLNQIQENPFVVNAPISIAYKPGEVVIEANIVGVAIAGGKAGDTIAVLLGGVVQLAADNDIAFAFGQALYWDDGEQELTLTSTNHTFIGTCALSKGTTVAFAQVLLNGALAPIT